jgi:hypothetical protein
MRQKINATRMNRKIRKLLGVGLMVVSAAPGGRRGGLSAASTRCRCARVRCRSDGPRVASCRLSVYRPQLSDLLLWYRAVGQPNVSAPVPSRRPCRTAMPSGSAPDPRRQNELGAV